MFINFLLKVFEENKKKDAIIWQNKIYNYQWLLDRIRHWQDVINSENINQGKITVLEADFSPNSIALFLALIEQGCIIVPLASSIEANKSAFIKIAQGEVSFIVKKNETVKMVELPNTANHKLYKKLKQSKHPGLVLFTSGSAGKPKAVVHDFVGLLKKFRLRKSPARILNFLLFDHWGGLNTMFHTLSNGGTIITVRGRNPDEICETIEKHQVEILPTSPTFLNLLLLSESYKKFNFSSLKVISYGTEPMPPSTLKRLKEVFPGTKLLQTYGLIEVGVLRTMSKSDDSLWLKFGGEGFQTRVVDGILQIRAPSAMLGYLNAPSPFTEDGWFITDDSVEVDDEYIKILGRKSEIINVGGEKVYPTEVENVIQEMENVAEVSVYGEKNPITGNIVCAKVRLLNDEEQNTFALRLKKHCRKKLANYKVPVKVFITHDPHYSKRYKKKRIQP